MEWVEPNPGLVDYVESVHILCRWKDHKTFLKEEAEAQRLRKHNEDIGYGERSPMANALYHVFDHIGDELSFYKGVLSGSPEALERVKQRAGVPTMPLSRFAYTSRLGTIHLPFDYALELAQKFCGAEPATVLVNVENSESDWARKARTPGEEHIVPLLNEYRAVWALLRQWAGHDAALAQREAEIQRLERLVLDAIYALQKAGLASEATRLRRAMETR